MTGAREKYTIVVADDEEELRKALIRRIDWEEAGFELVGEAENGVEALELVEKLEPDLLLTDVRMPFMTGIELARAVREIRPTMHIAFLSGFDDFSYAQQAIQYNIVSYMLKPISSAELTEELKRIREKMDQRFAEFARNAGEQERQNRNSFLVPLLLDVFQGPSGAEREEILQAEAVKSGFIESGAGNLQYAVLTVSLWNEEGKNCTTRASANSVDVILRKYVRFASFYSNGRVVSLLSSTRNGLEKYLHIITGDIAQSVKRIMNLSASIGVSRIIPNLSNCHEAYIEAVNAMEYSRQSDTGVHFITDIEHTESLDQEAILMTVGEVERLLRGGTAEELKEYLDETFSRMERREPAAAAHRLFLMQLTAAVFQVVYAVTDGEALQSLQSVLPSQWPAFFEDLSSIREKYTAFCMKAKELIAEQRKKSVSDICDRALRLIDERYMDPSLSLTSVSAEISISPNYLSALMKKSTGRTFVDLLTGKRMEKAREMILGTSMKIWEIAEMCGYNDQHYFSYCFKKYVGVSPNACRRQNETS